MSLELIFTPPDIWQPKFKLLARTVRPRVSDCRSQFLGPWNRVSRLSYAVIIFDQLIGVRCALALELIHAQISGCKYISGQPKSLSTSALQLIARILAKLLSSPRHSCSQRTHSSLLTRAVGHLESINWRLKPSSQPQLLSR